MSQTQGILRRPGEGPPPTPLTAKADAYFAGRLPAEEVEDLQDRLAHDPDLANEFLDWQRFSPPSPDLVPTATLAAWQQEDEARLRQSIAEEQEAREEAARLIGISVEDLGRVPPPPPPSYGAEEEERARRAIERLKPLTAAKRLELVKREPEEFGEEAVASACLVEAQAALPQAVDESDGWAAIAFLMASPRKSNSQSLLTLQLRSELYQGNAERCRDNLVQSQRTFERICLTAKRNGLTSALFWAEAMRFAGSLGRDRREFVASLKASQVAVVLWEFLGDLRQASNCRWICATVHEQKGDFGAALKTVNDAIEQLFPASASEMVFPLRHCRAFFLARLGRFEESLHELLELHEDYSRFPHWEPFRLWNLALTTAGLGSYLEAEAALRAAQKIFLDRLQLLNAALVSLDWAVFLLQRNRVDEVIPLAVSVGKTFEALGVARETLASWAILREAAERKELTEAIVRRVQEEISRPGAFRQVAVGSSGGGGPLANSKSFDDDLKSAPGALRTMNTAPRFPPVPGKGSTLDSRVERSAEYFAGELGEDEADELRDQITHDPDLAETLLDWRRFTPPSPDTLPLETLATWQTEDHARLHAAIAAEPATADPSPLVTFPVTKPAPRTRLALKVLAATAGLAASFVSGLFITAPVATEFIVPASTLRGIDEPTTVILPRWPHKVRFHIDASTLGTIEEPRARLLDSMTDAVVATTSAEYRDDDLWASFWGVDPGNYRLEIEDHAAGQQRPVAHHPIELLASSTGP
jgi:tetratricopeptide (TPR) repeat protein